MKKLILLTILVSAVLFSGCKKGGSTPYKDWSKATLSSNWHGANANMRLMNILSPHMTESSYKDRVNFIKSRGCNTVHVFVCNKSDGEYAGYSIYGNKFDWNIDKNYANVLLNRVKSLSKDYYVVLWLAADDSDAWNRTMISNPRKYVNDLNNLGFFKYATTVCIGLEADEYWNANQCSAMYAAVKSVYKGKVAVHQTSNKYNFAGTCDLLFAQMNPGQSKASIQAYTKKCLSTGKPVNMFELERQENRQKSQWALDAGAYAVGNW